MIQETHPFSAKLLKWFQENRRDLPWKKTRDPYSIWLSEIILQQTRVAQGLPYYEKFITRYPTVQHLAKASEEEVLKTWEGLGYYSRARNLHATAKIIVEKYEGLFPASYADLLSLKGVGPYTAAAIASFAFDLSFPAIDGNAIRVISRYLGIKEPIDKSSTKKQIQAAAEMFINHTPPADFNQAMMDFGSSHCTPDKPNCLFCPLMDGCIAYAKGWQQNIPVKSRKVKKTNRTFHYLDIQGLDNMFIQQRNKGIWRGLYEFPLIEGDVDSIDRNAFMVDADTVRLKKHLLTHQNLFIHFHRGTLVSFSRLKKEFPNIIEVKKSELHNYPFPKPIVEYLNAANVN